MECRLGGGNLGHRRIMHLVHNLCEMKLTQLKRFIAFSFFAFISKRDVGSGIFSLTGSMQFSSLWEGVVTKIHYAVLLSI